MNLSDKPRAIAIGAIVSILVAIIIGMLVFGDNTPSEKRPENLNSESVSAGVIVHGFCSPGWIKNVNPFPVRVKQVWIFQGETTKWVEVLQPNEEIPLYVSHQHGFHVYSLDGVEIGWIRPWQNGH